MSLIKDLCEENWCWVAKYQDQGCSVFNKLDSTATKPNALPANVCRDATVTKPYVCQYGSTSAPSAGQTSAPSSGSTPAPTTRVTSEITSEPTLEPESQKDETKNEIISEPAKIAAIIFFLIILCLFMMAAGN